MRRSEEGVSPVKPTSKKAKTKNPLQSIVDKMNEVITTHLGSLLTIFTYLQNSVNTFMTMLVIKIEKK